MTELYYYFATTDRRLGHGDGRKIVLGETHTVDVEPCWCVGYREAMGW